MTRKKYIHKVQEMILAVHRHPSSLYPEGHKVGTALKHVRDYAKEVPKNFGSYEAAWNSEAMIWAREYYGVSR